MHIANDGHIFKATSIVDQTKAPMPFFEGGIDWTKISKLQFTL